MDDLHKLAPIYDSFSKNGKLLEYKANLVSTGSVDHIVPFKHSNNSTGNLMNNLRPEYPKTYPKSSSNQLSQAYFGNLPDDDHEVRRVILPPVSSTLALTKRTAAEIDTVREVSESKEGILKKVKSMSSMWRLRHPKRSPNITNDPKTKVFFEVSRAVKARNKLVYGSSISALQDRENKEYVDGIIDRYFEKN